MRNPTASATIEFAETSLSIRGKVADPESSEAEQLEISVMVGVGTGLAYHLIVNESDEVEEEAFLGYVVTQTKSGLSLGRQTVETARQARKWVELLAGVLDWNKDLSELAARPAEIKALAAKVEQARQQAIELCVYVEIERD